LPANKLQFFETVGVYRMGSRGSLVNCFRWVTGVLLGDWQRNLE
jgi:hypothetical protein